MLKRTLAVLGLLFCLASPQVSAQEPFPIDVQLNGVYLNLDVRPMIENSRTLVPIRQTVEALGVDSLTWDQKTQTATIQKDNIQIRLTAGSKIAYVNNTKKKLDVSIKLTNGRILAPVRFIAETLGASVKWNAQYQNAELSKANTDIPSELVETAFTHDELFWLARIIHAESQGEPIEGQEAVGNVVLNRVSSSLFPDTIYGVIFDQQYAVQFEPVSNGSIYNNPQPSSIAAAKNAFRRESNVGASLYFYAPSKVQSSWISQTRPYYTTIGNHAFFL